MINLKIRINVDEQTFTLPVDTQFVPGIPEKDPVVTVTEITEPEVKSRLFLPTVRLALK